MEVCEPALYVFCFAFCDHVGEVACPAVDGHSPVAVVACGGRLCAVVSTVAVTDFCGSAAEQQMQELSWVAPRAMRHESVVEEVLSHTAVLPMPFGTLFSGKLALDEFVKCNREAIQEFLPRVADHGEWSVKGFFDRGRARKALLSQRMKEEAPRLAALSPGQRHFAEQRMCRDLDRELELQLEDTCRGIGGQLASRASSFHECAVVAGAPEGEGDVEVLNWAFLVAAANRLRFQATVQQINLEQRSLGLSLRSSGPWPPFRFVPPLEPVPGS